MGKAIMLAGVILVVLGFLLSLGGKYFPLGRLPGDILFQRGGFGFYFPIVTSIILSLVLTGLLNLVAHFWRR